MWLNLIWCSANCWIVRRCLFIEKAAEAGPLRRCFMNSRICLWSLHYWRRYLKNTRWRRCHLPFIAWLIAIGWRKTVRVFHPGISDGSGCMAAILKDIHQPAACRFWWMRHWHSGQARTRQPRAVCGPFKCSPVPGLAGFLIWGADRLFWRWRRTGYGRHLRLLPPIMIRWLFVLRRKIVG